MKHLLHQQALVKKSLFYLPAVLMFLIMAGCRKIPDLPSATVTTIASGLEAPMGIETDWKGNIWIAETGTANNDGKVVVVVPGASDKETTMMYDAIINLSSILNALSGEPEGPANLILDNGILYILAGDFLYKANVASFKPGDPPIDASTLPYEDIGSWVRDQNIVTPNDSHPYNLIKGPDGYLYIADAGANALIQRKGEGSYSVFAKFPEMPNPVPGPPFIQSVPTGIIISGGNFLVSTLTGYPFLKGQAVVYRVSMSSGDVSVFKKGLTTLTGIAPGNFYGPAVLHYASFGATGFDPNSGSLLLTNGLNTTVVANGLNMPTGIKQTNHQSWYVTSMGDGTLLDISYRGGGN